MKEEMVFCITGIDYNEIRDLEKHGVKTFELVCADHIAIAQQLKKGANIFIVNLSKQDVRPGVEGIAAKVTDIKVDYWRTVPREFDEKELLTARIQTKYLDEGRIIKEKDFGPGKGIRVSYETHVLVG
ncbi:DUF473 family protein [Candidatus Micrarchaeota archaeon]|nr:DUF473 family protein [Candidatus Micrarchaeota archaeon]